MKVKVVFEEVDIKNDRDLYVHGIRAECARCDHVTTSFGRGESSHKRCLALLREECPNNEDNFYINEDDD